MPVYTQSILSPDPVYLQTKSYSAQAFRKWFQDIASAGVVGASDFLVTLTSGMGISIAGGMAWVLGQNVTDQGMYRQYQASSTALTVGGSHASLPRLDQIILRIMDNTHDGSGFNEGRIEIVPGTPTAGATLDNRNGAANLAALGEASKNVLLLADILVPNGAGSLVAGNLRDRRVRAYVGRGGNRGTPPILTVADFQTYRDFVDGSEVYVIVDATNRIIWHLRYNASGGTYKWEVIGIPVPLASVVEGGVSTQFGTWVAIGASLTIPLSGDYKLGYSSLALKTAGSMGSNQASVFVNGGGPNYVTGIYGGNDGGRVGMDNISRAGTGIGTTYDIRGSQQNSGAGSCSMSLTSISLSPVRVSQ